MEQLHRTLEFAVAVVVAALVDGMVAAAQAMSYNTASVLIDLDSIPTEEVEGIE